MLARPPLLAGLILSAVIGVIGLGALQPGIQILLLAEYSTTPDQDASLIAWASGCLAAGAILAHLVTAANPRLGVGALIGCVAALGATLALGAAVSSLPWILLLVGVGGVLAFGHQTLAQIINNHTPTSFHGRINGW